MQELKCPNPECDSEEQGVGKLGPDEYYAWCNCGLSGPYKPTADEAIAAFRRIEFKDESKEQGD